LYDFPYFRATVSFLSASSADVDTLPRRRLHFCPENTVENFIIATKEDSISEADEVFLVILSTTTANVKIDTLKGITTVTIVDKDSK
jgi:hypothetical protein